MIPNISDVNFFNSLKKDEDKKPLKLKIYDKSITKSNFITAFTGAHGLANGLEKSLDVATELKNLTAKISRFFLLEKVY